MAEVTLSRLSLSVETKLVTETCCNCGILFAMTEDLKREKLRDRASHNRKFFYCPNGHAQFYTGKTDEQKLREELAEERRLRNRAQERADTEAKIRRQETERADKERRRANGYKGHATKISKRVKAGVCICCNRTFQDLAAHMATKHPTFTPLELDEREKESAQ
jgi:hypothetical protein